MSRLHIRLISALLVGLGRFPLRTIDEFASSVRPDWREHGGVMLPMYQSEAMWINFHGPGYPFVVKVAAGKINAVTGEPWNEAFRVSPQNYVVVPGQPWLDGFCVEKGVIRQFVAMPLGSGYSAEENPKQARSQLHPTRIEASLDPGIGYQYP